MAATLTDSVSYLTKPVNVVFQQTLLRTAREVMPYFAGSVPGEIQEHRGTFTISWRRIENLTPTTTALSELTGTASAFARTSVTPSITGITATVQKYGQYILLTEEADLANFDTQMDDLVLKLGISAGRSLNMLQRNEVEGNSTIRYANNVASAGAVVSKILSSDVAYVINSLARNVATPFVPEATIGAREIGTLPVMAAYWGICHPDVAYDIAQFTGFIGVQQYAGQVELMPNEFGVWQTAGHAVRFIQTSDASVTANAGGAKGTNRSTGGVNADLYATEIYGTDAVGSVGLGFEHIKEVYKAGDPLPGVQLIFKSRGSAGAADPLDEISTLGWKSWHAAKILNSNWILSVHSAATAL